MKGFRINPDKKYVDTIVTGLEKKDGHCPCRLEVNDATLCPCDDFINNKVCKCLLYVNEEQFKKIMNKLKNENK